MRQRQQPNPAVLRDLNLRSYSTPSVTRDAAQWQVGTAMVIRANGWVLTGLAGLGMTVQC